MTKRTVKKRNIVMLMLMLLSTTIVYAQKNVTFNLQSVPIKTLFDQIQRQTGYSFVYSTEDLKSLPPVSVNVKNETVNSVLTSVLKDTGLAFNINKRIITVKQLTVNATKVERTIRGQVLDESGEPLPGAAVFPTGFLEKGVSTDENGKFVIKNVPAQAKSISTIMLGMKNEIVMLGRKEYFEIIMREQSSTLDNVVVTGYQKIDKRYSTSAVTSIKMEDLNVPGFASIDQMMEGKIPDLVLTSNSGEINATPKLRIRGTSTLIGNRSPLWVLDGIVLTDPINLSPDVLNDPDYVNRVGNAISGINPQDILRIDVLKDAAATALYGTRAANGVIVITTKSGREGKAVVSYSNTLTARRRPHYTDSKINLMNSNERVQFSQYLVDQHYLYPTSMPLVGYEYALKNLYEGNYSQEQFNLEVSQMALRNTDWFDILCHNSFSQDHNASVSGGSENVRYYASLGYTDQDDVIKNTTNKRYTGMMKLNINISNKFDMEFNINAYQNDRMYNASEINPTDYAYNTARTIPAYNADGTYSYYKKAGGSSYLNYNILNELDNSYKSQKVTNVMGTLNLTYRPINWIHLTGILSVNSSTSTSEELYGESTFHSATLRDCELGEVPDINSQMPYGGEFTLGTTSTKGYTARFQVDANKFFGEEMQHLFNLSIGTEASSNSYNGYTRTDRGYYPDRGKTFVSNIPAKYSEYRTWIASNVPTITDTKTNLLSAYATLSYTFKELFTLNANTRYDGSNKFGSRSNEKMLPIWSVSGNANIVDIAKINKDWLDFLTFKASYGEQGNMLDDQTPVMVIKKGSMDSYYEELVSTAAYFANPDLKWEKTHSFNMGLESSFLSGRLQLGVEFYHKRTTDAFLSKKIADINGYNSYIVNSGTIINNGFNVNISATPVKIKNFYWITSGSLSKIYNKVTTTPGGETYELSDFLNGTAIVEGQPVGTFYSYKFIGLSSVDGGPLFEDWEERQSELKNLNNYDAYTKVLEPTGKREADITGSFFNTFTYKQWRLGVNLTYAFGASTRLFRLFDNFGSSYSSESNVNRDLLNRWMKPGDEAYTNIPAIIGSGNPAYHQYCGHWSESSYYTGAKFSDNAWSMYDYSTARVVSADYVKLQNISLTYEFDKKMIKTWGLGRIALTLSASNLHTWCDSRLKGQTPTQGGFSEIQLSDCPTYTFGFN
ncbi:MAG: SusC/RagA family TonB-linked outer membrane protein, partial [Bacteroidaceae bacterium]|nr:SusC/RagA family TonB-linked outer membrane protein [Bacteroidaceae bacterium]